MQLIISFKQHRRFAIHGLLASLLLLLSGVVPAAEEVRHRVSFPEHRQQILVVRSEFPVFTPVTELVMPNWTPGSYLIREFAANIDQISVHKSDGTRLPAQKISKDRWRVDSGQVATLVVNYQVFTPDINVSNSWASEAFSLINGASVFLYTDESRELSQRLEIVTDADRGAVFTALPLTDGAYRAKNYDELVDNPVAVANAPSYRFIYKNQQYNLLNVGENEFWDGKQAVRDIEKIVAETQSFWKLDPIDRPYWFLNFAVEAKGGLEHDYSTVIMTGRRQMSDREDYIKWLGVVAHEFFHVWNVRHMRPVGLGSYDFQHEQYTRQLWLAEGLTSYYDNLMMSRAGLINPEEYMDLLATDIHRLESTPGRFLRPVTEASFDAWIRHYKPNPNSINSTISYYTKGAVIGFVLDAFIRKESKGRHNLDEVMRQMYRLYSNTPYANDAFEKVIVDVAGPEAAGLLRSLLTDTVDPDVDTALDWYGLKLGRRPPVANGTPPDDAVAESGLGVIWEDDNSSMLIKAVLAGSGGAKAGLIPGDEIMAIADERLSRETLRDLMAGFLPGKKTTVLLSRRGKVMSLDITLDEAIPERYEIGVQSSFGRRHIKRLESLLGQSLR